MKLHDTIKNIYIKCFKPLLKIEVFSNGKWNKITSFNITKKQKMYEIKTINHTLLCTKNHILIDKDNNEILAIDSLYKNIITDSGIEKVMSVKETDIIDNAYDLSLENNSDHLYNTNGLLSHNCVIWDETAFTANNIADKIFTSIYPVISSSKKSKFIMVSTPNGVDSKNVYYTTYMKAISAKQSLNEEGWKAFRFDWWDVPGRDEAWKRKTIESIGERRFRQEFGNEFLDSSVYKKLIPDDIIEKFRMRCSEYKRDQRLQGKDLSISSKDGSRNYVFRVYHEFDPTRTYIASGDCGEGIGNDYSVLYIWDITETNNIKLCLKYYDNRVTLIDFAYATVQILKLYANPFLAIESNGIGVGYIEQLRRVYEYDNIVRLNREGGFGINSHQTIKSRACLWAQEMFTTQGFDFEIPDKDLIEEMTTFIKKDTVKHDIFAAIGDNHDDCIMSMIWMMWILHNENIEKYFLIADYFVSSLGKNYPKAIMPLSEYTYDEVNYALNDPVYKDFVNFKEQTQEKYKNIIEKERQISLGDRMFQQEKLNNMSLQQLNLFRKQQNNPQSTRRCLFSIGGGGFYDQDFDGPSW